MNIHGRIFSNEGQASAFNPIALEHPVEVGTGLLPSVYLAGNRHIVVRPVVCGLDVCIHRIPGNLNLHCDPCPVHPKRLSRGSGDVGEEGFQISGVLFDLFFHGAASGDIWDIMARFVAIDKFESRIQIIDHGIPDELCAGGIV